MSKYIKYKIVKKQECINAFDKKNCRWEEKEQAYWVIYRKGRILGLWHDVGDISNNSNSRNNIDYINLIAFDTYDQAFAYLLGWHKINYGDKYKVSIIC